MGSVCFRDVVHPKKRPMFEAHQGARNMATTILRLPVVKARTGLSRSTIYLRIAQKTFPGPVCLGGRAVG